MRELTARRVANAALALSLLATPWGTDAYAGDAEERSEIAVLFIRSYSSGDYVKLDAWYNKALREDARLPSGVYRANRMVRSIASGFGGASPLPPCAKEPCPRVNDAFWTEHQERAQAWLRQNPQSALAAMTLATAYSKQAWAYRGGGYANTVRNEDMKKFQELNHQSLRALFASAENGRKDPNWWSELLTYALYAQVSRQDYAKLIQDAIAAFPKNHDIYFTISQSLLPQWGGSYKAIAELATQAVENTKAEQGQAFYARIYWNAYDGLNHEGAAVFTRPEVDWPRIRAGFEDLVKRYPDNYNLNSYARLACVAAQDKKTTADVLQRIGQNVVPDAWDGRNEYARCKNWSQLDRAS
ncbi:MAG: hypothetical protein V4843_03695 [Pseudomonadota bacterium]